MARKHRGGKSYGHRKPYSARGPAQEPVQEPETPAVSETMQKLMAEADRIDKLDEERKKHAGEGFVAKPRAVRRFEKYANMGD